MPLKCFLLFLLLALSPMVGASFPAGKSFADFGLYRSTMGQWVSHNPTTQLARIDPDVLLDVVTVEKQELVVYLNMGNGYLTQQPALRISLTQPVREIRTKINQRMETIAFVHYTNGQVQTFPLSRMLNQKTSSHSPVNKSPHALEDSLNFQLVWSWQFPINRGSMATTAGDIDNDGRVEIISSMTHLDSITVGWLIILENDGDNHYVSDVTIPVNFHSWFHQIKITDWDQDGNKELTCAVGFRIRIWEFYGDKNYQYFDTNINFGGMVGCAGIEVVDTDHDNQLELLTIFNKFEGPWRSLIELQEFTWKSPSQFIFNIRTYKWNGIEFYSFAAGDMDNDGMIDILPGYAQLAGPGPVTMYYEECDPTTNEFQSRYFTYPYSIVQAYNIIDDLDGDGLNEIFITGIGNGFGGILYLKSDYPNHYQILWADSTILNFVGTEVKYSLINGCHYIVKATAIVDYNLNALHYYFLILGKTNNHNWCKVWEGTPADSGSYIDDFEVIDSDLDDRSNIIYKFYRPYLYELRDLESSNLSSIITNQEIPTNNFLLYQNYPNPFNSHTIITFHASTAIPVTINIYDISGKLIKEYPLFLPRIGLNKIIWNGEDNSGSSVASGVYFYRLTSGKFSKLRKMILIR